MLVSKIEISENLKNVYIYINMYIFVYLFIYEDAEIF